MPREVDQESLRGGAISRGITRDGDSVLRPWGFWTDAIHAHLRRVRDSGVLVPEPLGRDGDHEVLAFIEGTPLWAPGDRTYIALDRVADVGRLLRRYHDVAEMLGVDTGARWNRLPIEPEEPHGLICHNDFAPWNILDTPDGLAIIDWDLAAPGTRLWDLAHAAWVSTPIWNDADIAVRGIEPIRNRAERLAALLDAYGADSAQRAGLVAAIHQRLAAAADQARQWAGEERPGWRQQWSLPEPYRHGGGFGRDRAFLEEIRTEFEAAIFN